MMQEYLQDEHFGELAARVLADQWRTANEPPKDWRFLSSVDFSGVAEKRAARAVDPERTSAEAEATSQRSNPSLPMARQTNRKRSRSRSALSRQGSRTAGATARSRSSLPSRRGAQLRSAPGPCSFGRGDRRQSCRRRESGNPRGGENRQMDIDAERRLRIEELAAPSAVRDPSGRGPSCRAHHAARTTRAALPGRNGRGSCPCPFGRS